MFLIQGPLPDSGMDEAVQALASQFQKDSAFKFVWLDASKEQHRKETGLLTLTGIPEDEG